MTIPLKDNTFRQIIEGAPDAIMLADRQGIVRLWNAGAASLFGYSSEEALGQSLDLIIPEPMRARHWEGYHRVMATGETVYGSKLLAVPAAHRDGHRLSVEFSIVMLRDDDGKLGGIAAIMRDTTERWKKEKALKERLAELESAMAS
jgi:PAS domain S-box-containing protein